MTADQSSQESKGSLLQFEPFASSLTPGFLQALGQAKLTKFRLDTAAQPLIGSYRTPGVAPFLLQRTEATLTAHQPILFTVDDMAMETGGKDASSKHNQPNVFLCPGTLINTNTIEDFRHLDFAKLLDQHRQLIWDDMTSGRADKDPLLLFRFLLLTFANLKKFHYRYWFAFPSFRLDPPISLLSSIPLLESLVQESTDTTATTSSLLDSVYAWRKAHPSSPAFIFLPPSSPSQAPSIHSLEEWKELKSQESEDHRVQLGYLDPSAQPNIAGWTLRSLLVWMAYRFGPGERHVLSLKASGPHLMHLLLPEIIQAPQKAVGWERDTRGRLGPRFIDLAPMMDPTRLADTSLDLNLKLMRWRLMPELQLEKVAQTKCLLLGAGTLGCYVARVLLAWGVRQVDFVDSARVSYSNPARQPLFSFEDCLNGGKEKAPCASERLKEVFPGMSSTGYCMSIPMPGHPISPGGEEKVMEDVKTLTRLVDEHDVLFLLMDSRESRWLPTLLAAASDKIVINAALGFDSYLVMRHGIASKRKGGGEMEGQGDIGCYYCNDVVAPTDSLRNRTLDQQCTVTRPGLAALAGAYAAELLISLLHHPLGAAAPAQTTEDKEDTTPLGLLPHQIRGFLGQWKNLLIHGKAYDRCTACSDTVIQAYRERGWEFLREVFDDSASLERIVGLDKLREESEKLAQEWDLDDDDDDDEEDEESM